MRSFGKIGDDGFPGNVAAEDDGDVAGAGFRFLPFVPFHERADVNVGRDFVRDFDTDRIPSGDRREDPDAFRLHFHGNVVGNAGDLFYFHAGVQRYFKPGDPRPDDNIADAPGNAEAVECRLKDLLRACKMVAVFGLFVFHLVKQID